MAKRSREDALSVTTFDKKRTKNDCITGVDPGINTLQHDGTLFIGKWQISFMDNIDNKFLSVLGHPFIQIHSDLQSGYYQYIGCMGKIFNLQILNQFVYDRNITTLSFEFYGNDEYEPHQGHGFIRLADGTKIHGSLGDDSFEARLISRTDFEFLQVEYT
jgi:hypothetical protein